VEQKEDDVSGGEENGGKRDERKEDAADGSAGKHDVNEAKPDEERDNNL